MDEVLEKLVSTIITSPERTEQGSNDYQALYKNWGRLGNQEERRKELLEQQKTNRSDKIDAFRGILELVKVVEERNIFKPYNRVHYRPSIYVAGFNKTSATYSDVLMLSEWMIEKPADFSENWMVVPCPKGVRMLIVTNQGKTRAYTKYGHFKMEFRSALPGGNASEYSKSRCCVLDCFYAEKKKIMYILDILAWNNQPMTDGELEFRQYWIKSQLMELPQLTTISKKNEIVFQVLPMVPCTPESFNNFMMTYPPFEDNNPTLDGLLFYHKKAHYVSGETPLVGWLFPYMVPEVLGSEITVHPQFLSAKPAGYVDQAQFIQALEAKMDKRKNRGRRSSCSMDTSGSTEIDTKENPLHSSKTENGSKDNEEMEAEEKPAAVIDNNPEVMDAEEKSTLVKDNIDPESKLITDVKEE